MSHRRAAIASLVLIFIGVSPSSVLSIGSDSSLYSYFPSSLDGRDLHRSKRGNENIKSNVNDEVTLGVAQAEDTLSHLAQFEGILQSRNLVPAEGSPTHIASMTSWPNDKAVNIARKGYSVSRASYIISHQLCMRHGKPPNYCGYQLTKMFQTPFRTERCPKQQYRTFNGSCNNEFHPTWGTAFSPYSRLLAPAYKDGIWEPKERGILAKYANAVEISEIMQKKPGKLLVDITLNTASWGGLVAYDMAHTVSNRMFSNGFPITCCVDMEWKHLPRNRHPLCMPVIDKKETKCFNYVRSMFSPAEEYRFGPAQQMNAATHLLDGSSIYGSTEEMSKTLRTGMNGKIHYVEPKGGKPLIHSSFPLDKNYPFTGELRLNTDLVSAVMHMILIKEHNRLAEELFQLNPHWNDERLFQESRRIIIAQLQHITYTEWLPILLGEKEIFKYGLMFPKSGFAKVYNPDVCPSVSNSFANAAMRFVLSLLDEELLLFNEDRINVGNISFQFTLFDPEIIADGEKLDSLVRTLSTQSCQSNDLSFPEVVTKHLYSQLNDTGFDGLSMDIQRGRDHGLPSYVAFRKLFGFPYERFEDLLTNIHPDVVKKLMAAYEKVGAIDLIVGGLAELPRKGSVLGPVFANIIAEQMVKTRVGDRYFYDNPNQPYPFSEKQLKAIQQVKLASLLCDNTSVKKMQPFAFHKPGMLGNELVDCSDKSVIKRLNLIFWKENTY